MSGQFGTLLAEADDEIESLRAEVEHLRRQRDELQAAGTREVERRRAVEEIARETARNAATYTTRYLEQFGMRYPERLAEFVKRMAAKLDANAHKGDWRNESVMRLYDLLCEELYELTDAIRDLRNGDGDEHVISECADVAAFAFFIADVVVLRHG